VSSFGRHWAPRNLTVFINEKYRDACHHISLDDEDGGILHNGSSLNLVAADCPSRIYCIFPAYCSLLLVLRKFAVET
jgi:hypothetical protein